MTRGYQRWPGHPAILTTPWASTEFGADEWEAVRRGAPGMDTVTVAAKSSRGPYIVRATRFDGRATVTHEGRGRSIIDAAHALRVAIEDAEAVRLEDAEPMAKPEEGWTS